MPTSMPPLILSCPTDKMEAAFRRLKEQWQCQQHHQASAPTAAALAATAARKHERTSRGDTTEREGRQQREATTQHGNDSGSAT